MMHDIVIGLSNKTKTFTRLIDAMKNFQTWFCVINSIQLLIH
ncbi:hypothetical protein MICAK_2650004 [Microcystis aeruginosa PCC 9701]|uniref:Uncharacterized protein n=1 Tax=Microcystis aeruginosa PCC 9701 TaxID=721123 RepID=I4IQY0_MICAE|nr:hypothetical protein MICAK_2650004 [Microcystis aeruginosa PCC 9701]